ncbi:hypothetical protein GCM10025868_33830 [Angustibacter aerolatus]|uniref:Uncharacterized protein n=1 Tax=Angustibacter aerolatus TaxID=1162965 RepID=A0ABQ6JJG5_9ACTN|nr:hypothetical protein GCM10025868_33830 [Angustibacter aerolatus]
MVTLTSVAHTAGRVNLTDLQSEQRYRGWTAYSQSKAREPAVHDGAAAARRRRRVAPAERRRAPRLRRHEPHLGRPGQPLEACSARWPASSRGRSASRPSTVPGPPSTPPAPPTSTVPSLVGPGGLGGTRGHPVKAVASPTAYDVDLAGLLWQRSLELTGVAFDVKEQS